MMRGIMSRLKLRSTRPRRGSVACPRSSSTSWATPLAGPTTAERGRPTSGEIGVSSFFGRNWCQFIFSGRNWCQFILLGRNWCQFILWEKLVSGEIGVSSFYWGEIGVSSFYCGRNWCRGEIGVSSFYWGRNWCRGEIGVSSFYREIGVGGEIGVRGRNSEKLVSVQNGTKLTITRVAKWLEKKRASRHDGVA